MFQISWEGQKQGLTTGLIGSITVDRSATRLVRRPANIPNLWEGKKLGLKTGPVRSITVANSQLD